MKKILIIGDNVHSKELIEESRRRGIYTILTDNNPVSDSPDKELADEYWDISVTDIDALAQKAGEEKIDGVTCGGSELCSHSVHDLCKRLGLPFWGSEKAYNDTVDKRKFKSLCKECGLPVAKEFKLDINLLREDLDNVEYPVMVKPADGSSSIGLHVCHDEKELVAGYKNAYDNSESKEVIVEKYISGWEMQVIYLFYDGKPYLLLAGDTYGFKNDNNMIVFAVGPSRFMDRFEKEWKEPLEKAFKYMEFKNGVAAFQMVIDDDGDAAVMEVNYRLPGARFNKEDMIIKNMIDSAMGERTMTEEDLEYKVQLASADYALWLKPGTIASIEGVEEIKSRLKIMYMIPAKKVGDVVSEDGGMRRIAMHILFFFDDEKELVRAIDTINETIKINDTNGNDMVYRYPFKK